MLISHRSSDAVIAVYQNSESRQIIIHDLNPMAEKILGFSKEELGGKAITSLLPERIQRLLSEYVEYEEYGNDVGNVLSKVSSFCVVDKDKAEHAFQIKIQRSTPIENHDQFNLILQTEMNDRRSEAFRELLKENFKGHEVLDEATGLADRSSLQKDIELVMFYVNKKELTASVAVMELDDFQQQKDKYGDRGIAIIMQHIAKLCLQNLRGDDKFGLVGQGRLGLILFDAADDAAKMVLNRLRWLIAANACPMQDAGEENEMTSLSVRVAYQSLEADKTNTSKVLDILEAGLNSGDISANRVVHAGEGA